VTAATATLADPALDPGTVEHRIEALRQALTSSEDPGRRYEPRYVDRLRREAEQLITHLEQGVAR
jgi:hypothetical protein